MQQSACGGSSAAYLSLLSSVRGRLFTQMWSCESTKMPPTCPSIQLLGSGFGQKGSGSNFGTLCAAAVMANNPVATKTRESMARPPPHYFTALTVSGQTPTQYGDPQALCGS